MFDPAMDGSFFDRSPPPQQGGPRPVLRFFSEEVHLPGKSDEEGRPIYEMRDFVGITNPGSRDEVIRRAEDKAREDDYAAWAYAKWKRTQEQPVDGTPVETVPFINKAQARELKGLSVHTLEALADAPEQALQRMMGMRDLKKKAIAYMQAAKDSKAVIHMQSELDKRDRTIEMMRKQMEEMNARFEEMQRKMGA